MSDVKIYEVENLGYDGDYFAEKHTGNRALDEGQSITVVLKSDYDILQEELAEANKRIGVQNTELLVNVQEITNLREWHSKLQAECERKDKVIAESKDSASLNFELATKALASLERANAQLAKYKAALESTEKYLDSFDYEPDDLDAITFNKAISVVRAALAADEGDGEESNG